MAKKQFDDPFEDVEPLMEDAFSISEPEEEVIENVAPPSPSPEVSASIEPAVENALFADDVAGAAENDTDVQEEDDLSALLPENDFYDSEEESPISEVEFPDIDAQETGQKLELDMFKDIPVNLSVELGRSQISLKEVYELSEGSIIELERLVGEPLDLVINGQVIAQGEVVAIDNNYGLRVTTIVSRSRMD